MICSLRKTLLIVFFLLSISLFAVQATRAGSSEAHRVLENTINQVLAELQKPELKNPTTRKAVLARIEDIIDDLFSFEELSMRTVGPYWSSFTPNQKKRFMDVFETLLREMYLEKLDGYNGEKVSYLGETVSAKGDRVEIRTSVDIKGKPVPVAYRMLKKSKWEVYDVLIESVSMVQNYRSQFQDILVKNDAEKLIEQVCVKAEEARTHNKKVATDAR